MKKIFAGVLVLVLSGCGGSPVTVEVGRSSWDVPVVKINSIEDAVTVEKVEVNRGKCKAVPHVELPRQIVMGSSLTVGSPGCENVVEVSVSTSAGQYDFTF